MVPSSPSVILSFLPPLVSVLTTALIAAMKDPVGKAFDDGTKRVQFWKTMLETAPLGDVTETESYKEKCKHEMSAAVDAIRAVTDTSVGVVSGIILTDLGIVAVWLFARISANLPQSGISAITANWLAIVEAATISFGWFWGRWIIRRWVWSRIKPGAFLDIVYESRGWQYAVNSVLTLAGLVLLVWLNPMRMF